MSAHRHDAVFSLGGSVFVALLLFIGKLITDGRHAENLPTPPAFPAPVNVDEASFDATLKVISVSDGDTIDVLKDSRPVRLRFAEIDTPEKGQPFGNSAKQALSDLIAGQRVRVVVKETDRYGRSIADVYFGNQHVNEWMVRQGFAWHYKAYSNSELLVKAETEARRARRGLWSDSHPVEPWNWRKLSAVQRDQLR